jgi:hypothetical protein
LVLFGKFGECGKSGEFGELGKFCKCIFIRLIVFHTEHKFYRYKMIYPTFSKLALVLVPNFAKLAKLVRQWTMLKNFTFFSEN